MGENAREGRAGEDWRGLIEDWRGLIDGILRGAPNVDS